MIRRLLPLALGATLALSGALVQAVPILETARAQDDACPQGRACVVYEGTTLEIDPADGPIQFLVVQTTVTTITDFDGQTTTEMIQLAEFASDGDRFVLVKAFDERKEGVFAAADLGDTYVLREAN